MSTTESKVVLITGASSGIGKRTAEYLVEQGYRVFGTSRNPKAPESNGVTMLALDVTEDTSVQACVEAVVEQAGRIDVLVNNAGVEFFGALEESTIDEYKWLFETNVFGLIRVTQAVVPHMRQQGAGMIINIGSVAGSGGYPFQTAYAGSKHAVKGITDALRFEVEPFGIKVFVVQPNIFKSAIVNQSWTAANAMAIYNSRRNRMRYTFDYRLTHGPDPIAVTYRIERIIDGRAKRWIQPVGFYAVMSTLRLLIPPALYERHQVWLWQLTEQRGTFYHGLMWVMHRILGRSDDKIPPGLPPVDADPM